jgi:hypothetical protein
MRTLFILVLLLAAACGGGGSTTTIGPGVTSPPVTTNAPAPGGLPTGEQLCGLLTADDWNEFGYVVAASPGINSDGPGNAYCVYAGESGATGGLEFDAFVDATAEDAEATLETITAEGPDMEPVDLADADVALIGADGDYAAIAVRTGRFTFTIALPAGDEAELQLKTLASSVISRTSAYR